MVINEQGELRRGVGRIAKCCSKEEWEERL
jgi:hypothetical protein